MDMGAWKVLIVDDEHDSAAMIMQVLEHEGIEVHIAHSGRECLNIIGEVQPTLVIMDLALPGLDGWQTLSEIRANPVTASIPVVAITAYHSVNVAQDAMQAGFDGILFQAGGCGLVY